VQAVDSQLSPVLVLAALDQIGAGVLLTDGAGKVIGASRTAAGMLGYSVDELVGKTVTSFTHPDDLARWAVDDTARLYGLRRRLLHKDGAYRVTEGTTRLLSDGQIVTVLRDITALAETEDALSESAEQFRFVANALPALIAYVDRDMRYVWVNEAYRRWFGYAPEWIRGRTILEVLGAAVLEAIQPYTERALAGEEVTFAQRLTYERGPARDVRVTYVPHRAPDGGVRGFAVLSADVGELRAVEQALRRSEHLLEHAQSAAHVGSWEALLERGPNDRVPLTWSDETYRIFGYEPRSIEPTWDLLLAAVHPEDREALRSTAVADFAAGRPTEKEYRIVRPDGAVRMVHAWSQFEHDANGKPIRIIGSCQDITEQKRVEQELQEADRRKDEFLAMLSHELRNPLAPILNAVELLERTPPSDVGRSSKYRTVIARQVQHMKRLLDDLLDVSRVSQGKIQLRKESVELGSLVLQAVEVSRPLIVEKRQQLSMTLASNPLRLEADPTRLVQVFANLLNNAAKYTDVGGHIVLTVVTENGEAVVKVKDDGMGMRSDLLERAFDLFVQETRSLDRSQGGLGIGLTMVRSLVQMHGGWVRAFSEGAGRGSEFVIGLPLSDVAESKTNIDDPSWMPIPAESRSK
jgi:PAS domain S-box-containing protein